MISSLETKDPPKACTPCALRLRKRRPSLLDPVPGDLWFAQCPVGDYLVFYFHQQPLYLLEGSSLDQVTLNRMLFDMRCRFPRSASDS